MYSQLSIYIFVPSIEITQSINNLLTDNRYCVNQINTAEELKTFVQENKEKIDCLIILHNYSSLGVMSEFYEQGILLPVIIIQPENLSLNSAKKETPKYLYHNAEVLMNLEQLEDISSIIDKAITQFLYLGPSCSLSEKPSVSIESKKLEDKQSFLLLQQRRLAEKLKERLGYLGVYYNRNPRHFYRHLSPEEKTELILELTQQYQDIILTYFNNDEDINQEIDQFVNRVFFADLSVSQILEIHMELMDSFSQKLKLEGRSEEILLDYRLALIDIIAHLCEMYRRSIPREDLPFDVLFPVDSN